MPRRPNRIPSILVAGVIVTLLLLSSLPFKGWLLAGLIVSILVVLLRRTPARMTRRTLACPVPPLLTLEALADALHLTPQRLHWLSDGHPVEAHTGISRHYRQKTIPKRGGGARVLLIPKRELRAAQQWILRNILDHVPLHAAAHGFRRGHSVLTNAQPHCGRQVVVSCDLRDFFPSIRYPRVIGIFRLLGYPAPVAQTLALLCTTHPPHRRQRGLPQGAATSPALSNLVAFHLDTRVAALAAKLGFTYTRYADDCTFSGDDPQHLGALIRLVRRIVRSEHFRLHDAKLRIRRHGARQQVTGVVVNQSPGVPRVERRRLRAILHQAQQSDLEAQNRQGHPNFGEYLRGKIAYIRMINPAQAAPLAAMLASLHLAPSPTVPAPSADTPAYTPGPDSVEY